MSQKKNVKNTHFGRGRYNSDYAPDAKGVYHYIGSMYHIELEGRERRKMIFLLTALGLIAAGAFVLGGFSKGRTAQIFYALLPFVCGLLPTGYFLMGLAEWALHKGDFTRKGMDNAWTRMVHSAWGLTVCAGMAAIGSIIACIVHQTIAGEVSFLLGVLLQVGILVLCGLWGVGRANQDLLVCMVTYTLLASLTLTSFFSMPVTRFLADMLFAEREDEILPSFWGSNAIMLVAGTVLYGVFLLFSGATLLQGLLCLWLFNIMIVNWNGMSYLTAIKDYRGILCSFAAAIGVACLCALAALALGLPPVEGLLASIALGYGVMLAWDVVLLYRYFPQSERSPWLFLQWLDEFMPLALTGLFTNLGLFAHLVIIWAGPIGVQVKGLFYGAPYHDVPALIAFLTILVTTVNFVVSVEVNFYPHYRDYYSLFNDGGVVGDIVVAEEEMLSTLNSELRFCALKQLFVTAAVISLETTVLSALPLGFNNLMHGYFRTLCVGYGLYAVGNTVMLILLYFTDYKGAVLASGLFAGVAGLATVVLLFLPQQFYGFGFLLGAAVFFVVALMRLDTYTANLPYRILSQQPIVATDKTGRFTQLGRLLDRAEQRYEERRQTGEPHGAFERTVVRVYQDHWGGPDDR